MHLRVWNANFRGSKTTKNATLKTAMRRGKRTKWSKIEKGMEDGRKRQQLEKERGQKGKHNNKRQIQLQGANVREKRDRVIEKLKRGIISKMWIEIVCRKGCRTTEWSKIEKGM